MGKFAIGVRVRDDDGDEGVILDKRKGERLVRHDDPVYGTMWRSKSALTALGVVANDNDVSPCARVFEKEYSVGDRVRALVNWLDVKNGEEYAVKRLHIGDDGTVQGAWVLEEGKGYLTVDEFEPATPAVPTPTFAKGGRALSHNGDYVTVDTDPDEVGHVWVSFGTTKWRTPVSWLTKWEPKVGDIVAGTLNTFEYTVTAVNEDGTLDVSTPGSFNNVYDYQNKAISLFQPLPVAEQPAAEAALWAPVAGKYGKTRDGRKVGPAVSSSGVQPWKLYDHSGPADRGYDADGSWLSANEPSRHDLVAEWVDPVAEPESEVAVAEAPAKIEVKPGETWRGKSGALHKVEANPDNGYWVLKTADEPLSSSRFWLTDGSAYNDDGWNTRSAIGDPLVELVEPAAPQAKFKVGDRTVIARNSRGYDFTEKHVGRTLTIAHAYANGSCDGNESCYWWPVADLELAPTLPIGSTVTFTATGRLSAINDNGHMQVTFPDLAPAQNSFALPARYVSAA